MGKKNLDVPENILNFLNAKYVFFIIIIVLGVKLSLTIMRITNKPLQ